MPANSPLARHARTRLLQWRIAGLWALIATAAAAGSGPQTPSGWVSILALSLLPMLQLRIWDDLADRSHDRSAHPERVLAGTLTLRPFVAAVIVLGIATASLLVLLREAWQVAAYALLLAWLAFVYGAGSGWTTRRRLRNALVLVKYPVLALMAAQGGPTGAGCLAALALYLFLLGHDLRDERMAAEGRPS